MSLCGPAPAGDQAEAVELTFDDLRQLSCKIFASRQARCRFFNKAMFGEPGWDMLLALYSMEVAGPRQTVGRLTEKSGAPPTSALRWLNFLEEEHLVSREPHPNDGRTTFIELTDKGRKAIEDYLFSISQQFGLG
jgi:DNA-binding MarR family transcriptional regulator